MKKINTSTLITSIRTILLLLSCLSCHDFVKIDPPRTELVKETVFENDATAESAMTDIYFSLKSGGFASGGANSISLFASFSSDEQIFHSTNSVVDYLQFNNNELRADNPFLNILWSGIYSTIFKANSIIEGLTSSTGVSPQTKERLIGEAKFIRAFCYFYLVNLWGDIPLALTSDYKQNNTLQRSAINDVYTQVVQDLQDAVNVLPEDYSLSNNERVRANKWVATALLSRVFLYTEEWSNAEEESSKLIANEMFSLETELTEVFRGQSSEAIFQLWSQVYPLDRSSFAVFSFGPPFGAMRPEYVNAYEQDDQRWAMWGRTRVVNGVTYQYYLKYFDFSSPPLDYTTVFRLAEQYLIRAEARLNQDKLELAAEDVNIIRSRAGLFNTASTTAEELFNDIVLERKAELVEEWGHRWLDLKRWNLAAEILSPIKSGWHNNDMYFPIPEAQIINNPAIKQNPE